MFSSKIYLMILFAISTTTLRADGQLSVIRECRVIDDLDKLNLEKLASAANFSICVVQIHAEQAALLGDVYFDEGAGALKPFHRQGAAHGWMSGSIQVLKQFSGQPIKGLFKYSVEEQPQLTNERNVGTSFSPFHYPGTYNAIVLLPNASKEMYLHNLPETYLIKDSMVNSISPIDQKSFYATLLDAQKSITLYSKAGQLSEAIAALAKGQRDELSFIVLLQSLLNSNTVNSYEDFRDVMKLVRKQDGKLSDIPTSLFLKKLPQSPRGIQNYVEYLTKYVAEEASSEEIVPISMGYLDGLLSNPYIDPSNKLQSALLAEFAKDGLTQSEALEKILENKKAFK